jgi:ABC-type amino acid transport substrate-binding protein
MTLGRVPPTVSLRTPKSAPSPPRKPPGPRFLLPASAPRRPAISAAMAKADTADAPDPKPEPARSEAAKATPAPSDNLDLLVAVVMARPDTKSVSDLAGKTIAIDDRYAKSSGTVRTAIVAAGATEVQLSEGSTTAINSLTNGEVPAAVVALLSPDATETFPDIKGFAIFHVPLSPRAAKAR